MNSRGYPVPYPYVSWEEHDEHENENAIRDTHRVAMGLPIASVAKARENSNQIKIQTPTKDTTVGDTIAVALVLASFLALIVFLTIVVKG